jgi:hypothetical protein
MICSSSAAYFVIPSVSTPLKALLKEQETQLSERKPDAFRAAVEECGFCENIIDFLSSASTSRKQCSKW